jgi:hypothetical protein
VKFLLFYLVLLGPIEDGKCKQIPGKNCGIQVGKSPGEGYVKTMTQTQE